MDRLLPPTAGMPLPGPAPVTTVGAVVDRVFWSALGRAPSAAERRIAEAAIADRARPGKASPDAVADLLWAVLMKPEFQLIYSRAWPRRSQRPDPRWLSEHDRSYEPRRDRIYRALSRRGFMGATAGATLASLVGREPQQLRAAQAPQKATADAVIVLWMAGGMASTETFDPKRYTPFAPGVPIKDVLSTFPSIDTEVDHIKFTQGLENIASVIDKGAVIRIVHGRGPRLHPALAAPVSLAHRLHSAAADGDAAHRVGDRRARSGRRTPTCRRSSPSARRSRARAKSPR